jgi:NADH-quinone oxidoreductase subunit L
MTSLKLFAWLTLLFPLAGCAAIALLGGRLRGRGAGYLGTGALALSFASSVATLFALLAQDDEHRQVVALGWDYANSVGVDAQLSLLVDPLSVFMIVVVSSVSMLIHLYSISYMDSDGGYVLFFDNMNYYVISKLLHINAVH